MLTIALLYSAAGIAAPLSATEKECLRDADCSGNEYCLEKSARESKCVAVNCKDGAKAKNHVCVCADGKLYADGKCIAPKCSTDSDCAEKEKCVNPGTDMAACVALNCPPYEKTVDHACVKKPCEEIKPGYRAKCLPTEEAIFPDRDCFLCVKHENCADNNDCDDDHECRNKECVLLFFCPPCYEAKNHKCVKKEGCCATNKDCDLYEKCAGDVCVRKTCMEIEAAYRAICEQTGREAKRKKDTGINGADGRCYICF